MLACSFGDSPERLTRISERLAAGGMGGMVIEEVSSNNHQDTPSSLKNVAPSDGSSRSRRGSISATEVVGGLVSVDNAKGGRRGSGTGEVVKGSSGVNIAMVSAIGKFSAARKAKKTLVPASSIITTFLGEGADLNDESTWHSIPKVLSSLTSTPNIQLKVKEFIHQLNVSVVTPAEAAEEVGSNVVVGSNSGSSSGSSSGSGNGLVKTDLKRIVLDDFIELSLQFLLEITTQTQLKLEQAFHDYDDDIPGLEFHEFQELLEKELNRHDLVKEHHKLVKFWKKLVKAAGSDDGGGLIEDPALFSIASLQCDLFPPI